MKRTTILLSFLTLFGVFEGKSQQESIPKQLLITAADTNVIKVSEIFENYHLLKSIQDSSFLSEKKTVDRWLYSELSRMNVYNDSTYNFTDYSSAFKLFVENGPFCNEEDISNWENIGPRYVDQKNGWVSAVHYNPDPTNEYYLLGGRECGIFRSTDHGDHWTCVTDDLPFPILGVKQIIADINSLSGEKLYAVAGDYATDGIQNNLLISSDGGLTWTLGSNQYLALDGNVKALPQIQKVGMYAPSSNSALMIAITSTKVLISMDGGMFWRELSYPVDFSGVNTSFIDLAISGSTVHISQRVY
jgi:hypothetical protein